MGGDGISLDPLLQPLTCGVRLALPPLRGTSILGVREDAQAEASPTRYSGVHPPIPATPQTGLTAGSPAPNTIDQSLPAAPGRSDTGRRVVYGFTCRHTTVLGNLADIFGRCRLPQHSLDGTGLDAGYSSTIGICRVPVRVAYRCDAMVPILGRHIKQPHPFPGMGG